MYRDGPNKQILYDLTVVEEGIGETTLRSRDLILVPPIPHDYTVTLFKNVDRQTTTDIDPASWIAAHVRIP